MTAHNELGCAALLLWFVVSVGLLARWVFRYGQWRSALRRETLLTAGREWETLQQVRATLAHSREVRLIVALHLNEVGVSGIWRPVIVLPATLTAQLNDAELTAILHHELMHVRRWDNFFGALQLLVCGLYWFHPVAWFLHRRLLAERETVCDEQVLRSGVGAKTYAAALWKTAQFELGWITAGVAYASQHALPGRIESMLKNETTGRYAGKQRGAMVVVVTLAFTLVLGSIWLARTRAQESAPVTLPRIPGVFENGDNRKKTEALNQTPEIPLSFINIEDAPVVITAASLQAIQVEIQAAPQQTRISCVHRVMLSLENRTVRQVTGYAYESLLPGRDMGPVFDYSNARRTTIEPNSTLAHGKDGTIYGSCEMLPADLRQLKIKLVGVKFADGKNWGTFHAYATGMPIRRGMEVYADGQPPAVSADTLRIVAESASGQFSESDDEVAALSEVTTRPEILTSERPPYLEDAVAARISGLVTLSVVMRADGTVRGIRVVRGLSHGLTEQAIEATRRITFKPATKDGRPVSVRMQIEYRFGG